MASITSLRFFGALAGRALLGGVMTAQLCGAQASEFAKTCGNTISILNDSKIYDPFDKQNGGGEKRLRFRLKGHEPCDANECKLEVVAGASTAEKLIATIDLAGRTPSSYCVYELSRIHFTWNRRHLGCPSSYLLNVLGIILAERDGPFSERWVNIEYMYHADAGSVSLDSCMSPGIPEGLFRWHVWTVPLEDGSLTFIAETAHPRNPRKLPLPSALPYATSVFGAKNGDE
jgi:hypothetical protein